MLLLLILSGLFFIPQGFVDSLWQLIVLRFIFGLAVGGLIPCTTAFIRQACPISMQGEVLGYNQSFRFFRECARSCVRGITRSKFRYILCLYQRRRAVFTNSCCTEMVVVAGTKERRTGNGK